MFNNWVNLMGLHMAVFYHDSVIISRFYFYFIIIIVVLQQQVVTSIKAILAHLQSEILNTN